MNTQQFDVVWKHEIAHNQELWARLNQFAERFVAGWGSQQQAEEYLAMFLRNAHDQTSYVNILLLIKREATRSACRQGGASKAMSEWWYAATPTTWTLHADLLHFLNGEGGFRTSKPEIAPLLNAFEREMGISQEADIYAQSMLRKHIYITIIEAIMNLTQRYE